MQTISRVLLAFLIVIPLEAKPMDSVPSNFKTELEQKPAKALSQKRITSNPKLGGFLRSTIVNADKAVLDAESKKNLDDSVEALSIKFESPWAKVRGTEVQVYVELSSTNSEAVAELQAFASTIEVLNKDLNLAQVWLERSKIPDLLELGNVSKVRVPDYAIHRQGSLKTEGDVISNANDLRELGFTGKGIRVGILSDGANDWPQSSASGDLPQQLEVFGSCIRGVDDPLTCRSEGSCNEGTAMAEIVHDIAPDAELAVAAVSTSLEFLAQLDRLINEFKANIIVDDIGFFGEPFYEDGPVAQAVAAVSRKVLMVSAAGNSAVNHYSADDFNSRQTTSAPQLLFHDFDEANPDLFLRDQELFHGFIVPPRSGVFVILQWDQRQSVGGDRFDFALQGYNSENLIANSDIDNNSTGQAIEAVCIPNPSNAEMVGFVTMTVNIGGGPFKLYFLGAAGIEHPIPTGSIFGHPTVESTLAVGAINAADSANDDAAFYSSQGPGAFNSVNLDTLDLEAMPRAKPDLISIDGVSVTGVGGFPRRFFGTSAAAPHVAGVAALLMSVSPLARGREVKKALIEGAIDLGPTGFDFTYGHGRVDAQSALENLSFGGSVPGILLLLEEDLD